MLRINCSKAVKLVAFVLPDFCAISTRNARGAREHRRELRWPRPTYYPSRVLESLALVRPYRGKARRNTRRRTLKKFIFQLRVTCLYAKRIHEQRFCFPSRRTLNLRFQTRQCMDIALNEPGRTVNNFYFIFGVKAGFRIICLHKLCRVQNDEQNFITCYLVDR